MAQEYIVKDVKVWQGSEDPMYGTKLSVSFKDISEPVDMTAKKFPVVGETEYGEIIPYTTKAGNARQKFKRVQRDDRQTSFNTNGKHHDNSDGPRKGMCFNNAANFVNSLDPSYAPSEWAKKVYDYANELYKLGNLGESPKAEATQGTGRNSPAWQNTKEKFSQVVDEEAEKENEFQENLAHAALDGEPINLDDIPF